MTTTTTTLVEEMGCLLESGITDVFNTMLDMNVEVVPPDDIICEGGHWVAASVGFAGDVNGVVYLYLSSRFARALAGKLLGADDSQTEDDELTGDAIGEISNMIVGATKSRLCDQGLTCHLTIPSVARGQGLHPNRHAARSGLQRTIACDGELLLVELHMIQLPQT